MFKATITPLLSKSRPKANCRLVRSSSWYRPSVSSRYSFFQPSQLPAEFRDLIGLHGIAKIRQMQAGPQTPVRSLLLSSLHAELGPVIDGRNPRNRVQKQRHVKEMLFIVQLGGDPLHIVIVHEGVEADAPADVIETLDGMGDLKVVVIVVAGVEPLVQLVVGLPSEAYRCWPSGCNPRE